MEIFWIDFFSHKPVPFQNDGLVTRRGIEPLSQPCKSRVLPLNYRVMLAERGGFEPPKPFQGLSAFQADAIDHSATPPFLRWLQEADLNRRPDLYGRSALPLSYPALNQPVHVTADSADCKGCILPLNY